MRKNLVYLLLLTMSITITAGVTRYLVSYKEITNSLIPNKYMETHRIPKPKSRLDLWCKKAANEQYRKRGQCIWWHEYSKCIEIYEDWVDKDLDELEKLLEEKFPAEDPTG